MSDGTSINIARQDRGQAVVLQPSGDVDMSQSPALRDAIRQAFQERPERLVVDLDQVEYMDSSGLATLVEAMKTINNQEGRLVLCNMRPRVRAIFEIARLDRYFSIADSVDEAVDA